MDNEHFPTAKEALEYTNYTINKELNKLYSDIKEKIMFAANKGETYIYYNKYLRQPVIDYLRQLGYTINVENERNEVYFVIGWGEGNA